VSLALLQDQDLAERFSESGLAYGPYLIRKAHTQADKEAAWRLRFQIFNQELGEGIPENNAIGMDIDSFDPYCDHLLIEFDGEVVATIRLLYGPKRPSAGFYTQTEFDLSPWKLDFAQAVEMGRICIRADHRKRTTLMLLFWGLRSYMAAMRARYLFGCASLPPMDNDNAEATFAALQAAGATDLSTGLRPLEKNASRGDASRGSAQIPQLVSLYVGFGAKILSRPAYDPVFGCHDLLMFFDLAELSERGIDLIEKFSRRASSYGETSSV
jgi:putative hemolysin